MEIAIVGWGSLIWDPRELPREGTWEKGGPLLKVEFSRISSDGRLTLVMDPNNEEQVSTRYVRSPRADMSDAIEDLRKRESTGTKCIGFVNLRDGKSRCNADRSAEAEIKKWAKSHGFDGVVWTDLKSNFQDEHCDGLPFSLDNAVDYLQALPKNVAERARRYVRNAPSEIDTPLRRRLQEIGWLGK